MLLKKRSGFTLVELMVVIVIIGVLASLAIPRFTEASAKAKVAEAPRVLGSYESALLAHIAETGEGPAVAGDLIFETPTDSKWWGYVVTANATLALNNCTATASSAMGSFTKDGTLVTTLGADGKTFTHSSSLTAVAQKMVPNFMPKAVPQAVPPPG